MSLNHFQLQIHSKTYKKTHSRNIFGPSIVVLIHFPRPPLIIPPTSSSDSEGRFFISARSAQRWPQRECEAGTDRQKGFQINLSGQTLKAWLLFVRWKSGNAQVTDVAAATVSQGGFGRASQRWAAIPIRNAGPIPAIHQQGFLLPLAWIHAGRTARALLEYLARLFGYYGPKTESLLSSRMMGNVLRVNKQSYQGSFLQMHVLWVD